MCDRNDRVGSFSACRTSEHYIYFFLREGNATASLVYGQEGPIHPIPLGVNGLVKTTNQLVISQLNNQLLYVL